MPEREALFQSGAVTLASGRSSSWKIECDALTDEDWTTVAYLLAEMLPPFDAVVGVPRGGLKLAAALEAHATPEASLLVIADDVWTTGTSMMRFIDDFYGRELVRPSQVGVVAFSRGPTPSWVTALFRLDPRLAGG